MLARLLSKNGFDLGPLKDRNYESRLYSWEILNFQNFLLGTWDNPYTMYRDTESENYLVAKDKFIRQVKLKYNIHKLTAPHKNIAWKHPVASLLLPELSEISNTKFIRITRNKDDVIKSLSKRKLHSRVSLFPGRYGAGVNLHKTQNSERLVRFYENELNKYSSHFDLSLNYDRILDPSTRVIELEKLSGTLGIKSLNIPKHFFDDRTNKS